MQYLLEVNGAKRSVDVDGETPLLWVLRDTLDLKGTKFGCGAAQCGACTVHLDDRPIRACQTPIASVGGSRITTIEAIGESKIGQNVQAAWIELDVPQCGYCQAGQIMSATALLSRVPALCLGMAVVAFAAYVAQVTLGVGGSGADAFFNQDIYNAVMLASALALIMRAASRGPDRAALLLIGSVC